MQVREWEAAQHSAGLTTAADPKQVVNDVLLNMQDFFKDHPDFSALSKHWDEIANTPDPAAFMTKAIEVGIREEKHEMHAKMEQEVQARVADKLAELGIKADEPVTVRGNTVAGAVGDQRLVNLLASGSYMSAGDMVRANEAMARGVFPVRARAS